ncbi:hypothetical protein WG66_013661 [Moniliophthora roreri]|nr:hypothetical protein WG66_013661 [Moniliophthora roreri]
MGQLYRIATPVDITLQSSNGERFGSHTKNLEIFSDGFPPPKLVTHTISEPLELSEAGSTLRLLLAFMHNAVAPDIKARPRDPPRDLYCCRKIWVLHSATRLSNAQSLGNPTMALKVLRYKLLPRHRRHRTARQLKDVVIPAFEGPAERYLLWVPITCERNHTPRQLL